MSDLPSQLILKNGELVAPDDPTLEKTTPADKIADKRTDLEYDGAAPEGCDCVIACEEKAKARDAKAKKRQLIEAIRAEHIEGVPVIESATRHDISKEEAQEYIGMSAEEVEKACFFRNPEPNWRTPTANMIYKMMQDGHEHKTIFSYVRRHHPEMSPQKMIDTMKGVRAGHFPELPKILAPRLHRLVTKKIPANYREVTKNMLARYICTRDIHKLETPLNKDIAAAIDAILLAHPGLATYIRAVREFHALLGKDPETMDKDGVYGRYGRIPDEKGTGVP